MATTNTDPRLSTLLPVHGESEKSTLPFAVLQSAGGATTGRRVA